MKGEKIAWKNEGNLLTLLSNLWLLGSMKRNVELLTQFSCVPTAPWGCRLDRLTSENKQKSPMLLRNIIK